MSNRLNELIDVLTREQVVFQEYLALLNEQQAHLIQNDLDGVKSSTDKINELAQEASNLEGSRRLILTRISKEANTEPEKLSISKLIAIFDNPRFKELERFKNAMIETYQRINEQKARNELLIEQSIKMISQTMQYIHEVNNPKATYENPSLSGGGAKGNAVLVSRMI